MNLSDIVKKLTQLATTKILENVSKELEAEEKKAKVDAAIVEWISLNSSKLGIVQQFIVTQYLVPLVPTITQIIYDCLKKNVEGLTV